VDIGSSVSTGARAGGCHVIRLAPAALQTPAARDALERLWEFVRGDLGHSFERPPLEAVAMGECALLLCLRGPRVAGLVCVERTEVAELPNGHGKVNSQLGVALVWVRRVERRRGVASTLLDAARVSLGGLGSPAVPRGSVAFSQTTDAGSALASRYLDMDASKVPIYTPRWV